MRRVTISIEDELARIAEADVAAGRAPSLSAWVASAMRAKAQARAELVAELLDEEAGQPATRGDVEAVARALGFGPTVVERALRRAPSRRKRA